MAQPIIFDGVLDLTGHFKGWRQQKFRSLPLKLQRILREEETKWRLRVYPDNDWIQVIEPADEVSSGLWVGSADSARSPTFLGDHSIGVILNMARELDDPPTSSAVQRVKIGIDDGALANIGAFEKAADVINNALRSKKNILVHCQAGISRSVSAVLAYLMLYRGMGWEEGLRLVRHARAMANPHPLLLRTVMRDFGSRFRE